MRTITTLLIALLLASRAIAEPLRVGSPFDGPLGKKYRTELELLVVPPDRLPPGCLLATEIAGVPLAPASTNPFVTEDTRLIEFFAGVSFGGKPIPGATFAMSALYFATAPRHEIGMHVIGFGSAALATSALGSVKAWRLFRKGELLVVVWRDDEVGAACERAVRDHLIEHGFEQRTGQR